MQHNQSVKQRTFPKITEMTSSYKYLSIARMMLFTQEQFIWVHQSVNQLELSLILVLNISLSLVFSVMMKQQETINSKSMIRYQEDSYRETKCTKDARQWLMICINQILIKFYLRPHLSLHMVLPNFKVLYGKTIHASNLLKVK